MSGWDDLAWEKVDVEEEQKERTTDGIDDKEESNAVFFGLEVIDGSKYKILSNGGNSTKNNKNNDRQVVAVIDPVDSSTSTCGDKKNTSKKGDSVVEKKTSPQTEKENDADKTATMDEKTRKKIEQQKEKKRKKREKQKAKKKQRRLDQESSKEKEEEQKQDETLEETKQREEEVSRSWNESCQYSLWLHSDIVSRLAHHKFMKPTPIQAATLLPSILGRRNIVGAAPTGSGKTLSYALPILQFLLQEKDNSAQKSSTNVDSKEDSDEESVEKDNRHLRALVMCPTRELALQVCQHFKNMLPPYDSNSSTSDSSNRIQVGTIVGGLAQAKQERVLTKVKPSILVATPGRLWELISSEDFDHLLEMQHLQFLVIDEADRMIAQKSFPQLRQILSFIRAQTVLSDSEEESSEDESDDEEVEDDDEDRLHGLKGVQGEAKVQMLSDDILKKIELMKNESKPEAMEVEDDEMIDFENSSSSPMEASEKKKKKKASSSSVRERQTFIYSATLTLPSALLGPNIGKKQQNEKNKGKKKGTGKSNKKANTVEGALAEILECAGATGPTKVVDLSITNNNNDNAATKNVNKKNNFTLPPGLSLYEIKCTQKHKDSHCYAYLKTTTQGSSGPCLIFCNSISAVKRVSRTLQILGLENVKPLHAQMNQKARLSALESLKKEATQDKNSKKKKKKTHPPVVVATDVAARGLDIPSIATVIHYDVARAVDTFIHRAGRTARGLGENAVGCSISLVAPGEDERKHKQIYETLSGSPSFSSSTSNKKSKVFQSANMDGHLLQAAQERTALATKIYMYEENSMRVNQTNKWFEEAAKETGIDLEEAGIELEKNMLNNNFTRDNMKAKEALHARSKLRELLSQGEMKKTHFGKFALSKKKGMDAMGLMTK